MKRRSLFARLLGGFAAALLPGGRVVPLDYPEWVVTVEGPERVLQILELNAKTYIFTARNTYFAPSPAERRFDANLARLAW